MKKLFMKLFLLSVIAVLFAGISSASQIHLKNGIVLKGEIISNDGTSVIVKEKDMGILKLSTEKILKIVKEKGIKEERIHPASLKQQEYFDEYAEELRRKGPISIYISGGLNNIDGGDLNQVITEYNDTFEDLATQFPDADIDLDWDEIKWITSFKGELLFNFTPYFSLGLGAEYLTKTNPGALSLYLDTAWVGDDPASAYQYVFQTLDISADIEEKLTVIPLTASIHLFVPMGNTADFFITGGVGYYLGKLESTGTLERMFDYQEDYYDATDTYLDSWLFQGTDDSTITYEAKCNAIGFHGGAGLDIKFSPNMSLVIEGSYRYVNLKDWEGDADYDMSFDYSFGWFSTGIFNLNGTDSGSFEGNVYYYESTDDVQTIWLPSLSMEEEQPTADEYTRNISLAEIKLNGFSIKGGIKISF